VIGSIYYLFFLMMEWSRLQIVESFVLLAILLFFPIIFSLIDINKRDGSIHFLARWILLLYPFAAFGAMLSLLFDQWIYSLLWFVFTGIVALYGLIRLAERGYRPIEETSIDMGMIYLFLGGFWLFSYVADLKVMYFPKFIILLTAIHFHYSAFIIPIFIGFLGRKTVSNRTLYSATTLVVIISPMLIAIGIAYSRMIEFLAVLIYVVAMYLYGVFVFKTTFQRKIAKILVSFSATILILTISFSLIYAYGRVEETVTISFNRMIFIHGVVNAVGVILPGLIGWIMESTTPSYAYYGVPRSSVFGTGKIGDTFLKQNQLIASKSYPGLVDKMEIYSSKYFEAKELSILIIDFYENTRNYQLRAKCEWSTWFKPFAFIYKKLSRKIQQLNLPISHEWQVMHGDIIGVTSESEGRGNVRTWIRKDEKGETIFVALYSHHVHAGETFMNIALPLPFSNLTGILKPLNNKNKLVLTSVSRKDRKGDEGIYLVTSFLTLRLPLSERFIVKEKDSSMLTANHQMWIFGLKFLEIDYEIEKTNRA
jgi:hypothetical protein